MKVNSNIIPTKIKLILAIGCWTVGVVLIMRRIRQFFLVTSTKHPYSSAASRNLKTFNTVVEPPNEIEKLLPPEVEAAHQAALKEEETNYTDPISGMLVFTRLAHIERRRCCGNRCRHCPYGHINVPSSRKLESSTTCKSNIYTRGGDAGKSSLFTGERVEKSDSIFEALGAIDELNSMIGVAKEFLIQQGNEPEVFKALEQIQRELLDIGSLVATPKPEVALKLGYQFDPIVLRLEQSIDCMDQALPPLNAFILPGGGLASAHIHLARSACRRAERAAVRAVEGRKLDYVSGDIRSAMKYMNRLSDYLFVCARFVSLRADQKRE